MPDFPHRLALVALALLTPALVNGQEARPDPARAGGASKAKDPNAPTFVYGDRIDGVGDREAAAQGNAEVRKGNTSIKADSLRYFSETEDVDARGSVRVERDGDVITGPSLKYRMQDSTGVFERPDYLLAPRGQAGQEPLIGRGHASEIQFLGEDRFRISDAYFTTCKPENNDWYLEARQLDLDYTREVGTARQGYIYFKSTPILWLPYLDFSLNNERKSGFLPPHIGTSGRSGAEVATPYYLNLAPNRDATLTPRYMTKRGLQLGAEVRYLEPTYSGEFRGEVLPNDQIREQTRSAVTFLHRYAKGPVSGGLNINQVSDDNYFRDLANRINLTSQVHLLREGYLSYSGGWGGTGTYAATGRIQSYQTLQDPLNPVAVPYARRPQLSLTAARQDIGGFDFSAGGEYVDFGHPTNVLGKRSIAYPSVSLPLLAPGGFLTPKIGVHATHYALDRQAAGVPDNISRTLPIASVDSGLIFERDTQWRGQTFTQTLEPRAYYVYVPFKDQSQIPVFDTAVADLNYAQIFSENIFAGGDRINDANQLTLAMTSRLLSPTTGQEGVRATIAQRYYFRDQRVTLNATDPPRNYRASDWLAAVAGQVAPKWTVEAATQYNPRETRAERMTVSARYQPEMLKTLNLSYRFLRDQLAQVDLSGQWPFGGGWYGVGRFNYSTRDKRIVEALAGIEYNADCWIGRVVVQRFALAPGTSTSTLFLQLELNGLSRIGSNPLEALKRNIPGYQRLNAPVSSDQLGRPFDFYD